MIRIKEKLVIFIASTFNPHSYPTTYRRLRDESYLL